MEKGFSPEIVEQTLDELEDQNYLQDERFAVQFGRAQIREKSLGPDRLKEVLFEKKISPDIVEQALRTLYTETPALEVASQALQKKLKQTPLPLSIREQKRLSDYLRRRGFEYDIINKLLRTLKNS